MQYAHCLRNTNNQSTTICWQTISVDIEVEYFCDNVIYHHPTSVCIFLQKQCTKSSMELIWKYERLSSIPFLKSSIPFWHLPYSISKLLFHSIPCPGCRFYRLLLTRCRTVSNNGSGSAPAQNILAVQVWFEFTWAPFSRFRFGSGSLK